jgi:hypothetical protein
MAKIAEAFDALRLALELLDNLKEWAAAAHVSTALSLLHDVQDSKPEVLPLEPPLAPRLTLRQDGDLA